jgi:hypothetical protein
VKIEGKSVLPLQVLARPFSHIYKDKDESKGTVEGNVPVFQPYYVYTRPESKATETEGKGLWYEVGSDTRGTVLGWMKAEDVFEWKQTMILSYTHPQGRKPVLMFEQRAALLDLVNSPQRKKKAEQIYAAIDSAAIDSKKLPPTFPVRSVEPKKAVNLTTQFYLLPILEFGHIELGGREGRILKLAAATLAGPDARNKTDLKENQQFLREATEDITEIAAEKLKALELDLVFVIDLTQSMQPYIDATRETIRDIAKRITQDTVVGKGIHFGLWGYRDSKDTPQLEFNTKNFTPTLQQVSDFEKTLGKVKEAKVDSEDYPEDVFSGVQEAILHTQWNPKSLRFIVLIGDAPSHEKGHPRNYSGQDETTLRQLADKQDIYIFALHIKPQAPRLTPLHELAEKQFRVLARNKSDRSLEGASAYSSVKVNTAEDRKGFEQASKDIAKNFVSIVSQAKQGRVATPTVALGPGGSQQQPSEAAQLAANMGYAALVEWIGKETEAKAPRDIVAWAIDKDLIEPTIHTMDVNLLITKSQLDSLKTVLRTVIAAGRRGQIGGEHFFNALQATTAMMARTPEQIKNVRSMADSGLIPEFLMGLPYKSQVLEMSNELWASWSPDDQDSFLKGLEAKERYYTDMHDTPAVWITLHKGDDPNEAVAPISLEMLP